MATSPLAPDGRLQAECVPSPNPLPVSTPSKTKNGVLRLTFSKPDGSPDVKCRSITVSLPIGTAPTDLTDNPVPIDGNQDGGQGTWLIVQRPSKESSLTFVCTPEAPGNQVTFDATRRFTLKVSAIPVARTPGDVRLTVTAHTATDNDWEDRPVDTPEVGKHREDASAFFFRAFSSVQPRVANKGKATLRWEGSEAGTEYWLSWDEGAPVKVTGLSHQSHELTDTTTFVLDARTKGADGQDVHHYLSTTVTVKDPDIVARTVTASDKVTVTETFTADNKAGKKTTIGATTFDGNVTVTTGNTLTVAGQINANGGVNATTLTTSGALNANGTVTAKADVVIESAYALRTDTIWSSGKSATGTVNLQSKVDFKQPVTASNTVTANRDVTIDSGYSLKAAKIYAADGATTSTVTVKSKLAVEQAVTAIGAAQTLFSNYLSGFADRTYTAAGGDGFVHVRLQSLRTDTSSSAWQLHAHHRITVNVGGVDYQSSTAQSGWKDNGTFPGDSVVVPVKKGQTIRVTAQKGSTGAWLALTWTPLGGSHALT
ncbi:hypothetical protein ACFC1T_32445 [Kitasatospora sp. NPDC056076]|uniref:hypothetical protein n=1 Tax=Kitasatospora sp. NPDC056076 TaxID=3345703 RepID=UPI0035D88167